MKAPFPIFNRRKSTVMKKLYILTFIFSISLSLLNAQEQGKKFRYMHFEGTINKTLKIKMDLMNGYEGFRGTYYYVKNGDFLYLESIEGAEGMLTLKESTKEGETTGFFEGKWTGTELVGTWKSADGRKTFSFFLEETYNDGSVMFMPYSIFDKQKLQGAEKAEPAATYKFYYLHPINYKSISKFKHYRDSLAYSLFGKQESYDEPKEMLQASAKQFFDDYQETNGGDFDPEMSYAYNWEETTDHAVILNEQGVICTSVNWYAFTGGAHGNFATAFKTYDMESDRFIKLKDIFMPGYELTLSKMLEKMIRERDNIPEDQSLTDAGMFVEEMLPTENFYLSRSGIYFYYNVYEIAPYAGGPTELYLSFSDIKTLLKPQSILNRLGVL